MRQNAPRRRSFPGAGSLLLLAAACAQVLNVDGIEVVGGGPPEPPAPPPRACQPRQLHCEGAALQICREDGTGFRTARVCSSAALCCDDPSVCPSNPGCQAPACTSGDFKCDGQLLSVCNEGQTGWTPISTCASAEQCNASLGRCSDQPCNPSTPDRQCSSGQLLECGTSGWAPLGACSTHALCNADATSLGCRPTGCLDVRGDFGTNVPSPFRCDNGDLLRCNDQQTDFEFVETCLNLFHCSDLRDDVVGDPQAANLDPADLEKLGCTPPACTPGKYRCEGSKLMRCNVSRTGYSTEVQDCGSEGRCNASTGSCTLQDCAPETTQCSGNEYQVCTADRRWRTTDSCAGAAQCDPRAGCRPATCEVTEYRCTGAALERCNIDGTDWIPIHTCATAVLCDVAAKRCTPPLCNAGELRCSRDGKLDRCSPGRNAWETLNDCRDLAQLPDTASPEQLSGTCDLSAGGRCNNPPSCTTGAVRCNAQYLEQCRDNAWQPRERCATSALCEPSGTGSCRAPACSPGKYRCVTPGAAPVVAEQGDSMRGLTLQVCDEAGAGYVNVRDCPANNYCDAGHGQCDLCAAVEPLLCFGPSLYLCSADGQERELEKACTSGCVLAPGTATSSTAGAGRPTCREDLDGASAAVAN